MMPSVAFYCHTVYHYAECHYAKSHGAFYFISKNEPLMSLFLFYYVGQTLGAQLSVTKFIVMEDINLVTLTAVAIGELLSSKHSLTNNRGEAFGP